MLAYEEIVEGQWWPEIAASIFFELKDPIIVGDPKEFIGWRFRFNVKTPQTIRREHLDAACAYISSDTKRLLAGTQ